MDALTRAIQHFGSAAALAKAIGLPWGSTVTNWRARGRIPPERAAQIDEITNGMISRRDLCPDFPWGDVSDVSSKEAA